MFAAMFAIMTPACLMALGRETKFVQSTLFL